MVPGGLTLPLIIIIIVTVITKKSQEQKNSQQTDSRIMHKYEYICGARFPSRIRLKDLL